MLSTLCLLSLPLLTLPPAQEGRGAEVRARFVELHAAEDAAALRELWAENEDLLLVTIDADLEGGLALWESAREQPDTAAIEAHYARARWGAEIGSEVTGRPIFAEYAAAFSGWSDAQKAAFRGGQAAHRESRRMLKDEDYEGSLVAARNCAALALPLGDWWGAAMGYAAEGEALRRLGKREEAIAALSQARLLYNQLALRGSELRCLEALVEELLRVRQYRRAMPAARAAVALAETVGDPAAVQRAKQHVEQCEQALGLLQSDG